MKTLLDQPTKSPATNGAAREPNGKCHHLADAPVERNGHSQQQLAVRYFESPSMSLKVKVLDETARNVPQTNGHAKTTPARNAGLGSEHRFFTPFVGNVCATAATAKRRGPNPGNTSPAPPEPAQRPAG